MLSRKPIVIDDQNFYYEQLNGLLVVHQAKDTTDEIRIPWHFILASAKRKKKLDRQWRVKKIRTFDQ